MDNPEAILAGARDQLQACADGDALKAIERTYLGKDGVLARMLASIPSLPPTERPIVGKNANLLKADLLAVLAERKTELDAALLASEREGGGFDPTLPAAAQAHGSLHPITQVMREVEGIFQSMGYHAAR